jgi:glucokinase
MRERDIAECRKKWAIAVDLGGTWIRAAAVCEDGTIGPIGRRETFASRPHGSILADVAELVAEAARGLAARGKVVAGLGIGIATVLDGVRTVPCPTLPTLGDLDVGDLVLEQIHLPVATANDAACFAMGEAWMGAGRGCSNVCGLTLGTGIGLGIVIGGHIHSGSHGFAGEIWRTPTVRDGCLEDHVSGRAIEQHYRSLSGRELPGAGIADLATAGDTAALGAFLAFGRWLGATVAGLVNLLDPELVVLGGTIAKSYHLFRQPVEEALARTTSPQRVRVERSHLGESAALLGAAKLLWDHLETGEARLPLEARRGYAR